MKNKFKFRGVSFAVLFLLLIIFLVAWPLPDEIESPGSANNLSRMISVDHRRADHSGKLMLTSVLLMPAHPVNYLWAKLDPHASVISDRSLTAGEGGHQYNRVQKFYMRSAINQAIFNACRRAHCRVTRRYRGIYVVSVMKASKLRHRLRVGDTIIRINGHHFKSASGYQRYLAHRAPESRVRVSFNEQGRRRVVSTKLIKLPGTRRHGLGVTLTDNVAVKTRVPVKVRSGAIGGPSAGLMFSLQMYEQLTHRNLTRGRKIAGTGTIGPNGQVGEIGGIDKKVVAARRAGATIFLAPYVKPSFRVLKLEPGHLTNYQLAKRTARKYAPGMRVIPVRTFNQAVVALEK